MFAYVIGFVMPRVLVGIGIGLAVTVVVWWLFTFVWQGKLVRVQETAASLAARAGPA